MVGDSLETGNVNESSIGSMSELLLSLAEKHSDQEFAIIKNAYNVAVAAHEGQARLSGEPYIEHSLAVAGILYSSPSENTTLRNFCFILTPPIINKLINIPIHCML